MKLKYRMSETIRGRAPVIERLRYLQRVQELSRPEIDALQQEKFSALIEHAHRTVPYYRRLFDERGLSLNDVASTHALCKLPLLSRPALLANQDELLSSEADSGTLSINYSSGSTGQRACFRQDRNFRLWMRAHQLRTYSWCGKWQPGEKFALLWGSEIYWKSKTLIDKIFNILSNRREFNTFKLSPELLGSFARSIESFDPVLISSYSNALHLIAREVADRGIELPSLRAVQATSEPFPPAIRERVATVFGCEVYDKYGSRETNIVSHEGASHDGMLIQTENVVVEIVRSDGTPCDMGEVGRVVLTTLNNWSMPLIRYETTDISAFIAGENSSDYKFPRMAPVRGRQQDLISTPRGDFVDAYFFSYLLMRFDEISWFQVVQDELDRLRLRVVAPRGLSKDRISEISERIQVHTGFPFRFDFEFLPEMPESATGKYRLCVSNIAASIEVRAAVDPELGNGPA